MGLCGTKLSEEEAQAAERSRQIEEQNTEDHNRSLDSIKLLLLGAGESGKSTIVKQMRVLHGDGYASDADREYFTELIRADLVDSMKRLVDEALQNNPEAGGHPQLAVFADTVDTMESVTEISPELLLLVRDLWKDELVQAAWAQAQKIHVPGSFHYFCSQRLEAICAENYVPTVEDILRARIRTSGIIQETYMVNGTQFHVYDVGGQVGERKKWINCFDNVNALIFVVALSEFDQHMWEDNSRNRMVDALTLFDGIANDPNFASTPIILFLNKCDLFASKIRSIPIRSVPEFSDYEGDPYSFDDGVQYFVNRFLALNHNPSKMIFSHRTTATDTESCRAVIDDCARIIMQENIEAMGFGM